MAELGSSSRALLAPSVKAPWHILLSKFTTRYVPRSKFDSAENVYKAQLKVDTRQLAPTAIYNSSNNCTLVRPCITITC